MSLLWVCVSARVPVPRAQYSPSHQPYSPTHGSPAVKTKSDISQDGRELTATAPAGFSLRSLISQLLLLVQASEGRGYGRLCGLREGMLPRWRCPQWSFCVEGDPPVESFTSTDAEENLRCLPQRTPGQTARSLRRVLLARFSFLPAIRLMLWTL